eukprot:1157858-Pelagomonas_calceolata.AAC.2
MFLEDGGMRAAVLTTRALGPALMVVMASDPLGMCGMACNENQRTRCPGLISFLPRAWPCRKQLASGVLDLWSPGCFSANAGTPSFMHTQSRHAWQGLLPAKQARSIVSVVREP